MAQALILTILLWSRQPFNPWTPVILLLPAPGLLLPSLSHHPVPSCPVPTIFSLNLRLLCLTFGVGTHSGVPLYESFPRSLS